jgi:hypothetical protein
VTEIQDVDWAEVERRGRRLNWLAFLGVPVFFAAIVLLTGGYALWKGTGAWAAVGALTLYLVVMQALSIVVPRFRTRTGQAFRLQYALRHRVDPGPDLREKTDGYARRMAGNAWFVWLVPFLPLSFLLDGQWDRPLQAVPSAIVLVGSAVAMMLWWRRQARAARQWLADRPGPERDLPPLTRYERWLTGRRLIWLMVALVGLGVVLGLAVVLIHHLTS